ncbi:hypothetical protein [Streptomyces sp. KAU_LT]|uniref:hypothetical protein n=1 Tax=Streptomyces sp. KAU_LT TaxID=3046669 RepID=UPI0024B8101D|nr:hypothetical protein [Streptomyces sp. KAU_LT]MDI9829679.1 hypothetical protein [Streptomyces sp. KAU_LT]
MAVAGCGSHTAQILDRRGAVVAAANVLTECEWTRTLDAVSTARAVIQPDEDCCGRLSRLSTWRTRLVLFRDGKYCWDGPITNITWSLGQVELAAQDVLAWLGHRVPHEDKTFTNVDLSEVAQWLIADGFQPDDPGHSVQVVGRAGVSGSRSYSAGVGQTLDHLGQLAEAGIDFTAIGSKILLLPEDHLVSVGRLSDTDMPEGLEVSEDGAGLVTRWVVAGSEDSGVIGTAGGVDSYYGLHERYVEQSEIADQESADEAARARQRASGTVPVVIDTQQVTISPLAAVDVPSLVPGWCLDITSASTCRPVSQRLKITGVRVAENAGNENNPGAEQVQVQVAASGAETF